MVAAISLQVGQPTHQEPKCGDLGARFSFASGATLSAVRTATRRAERPIDRFAEIEVCVAPTAGGASQEAAHIAQGLLYDVLIGSVAAPRRARAPVA